MSDKHIELTAETRQLVELLAETRYYRPDQHPPVYHFVERMRQVLKELGKTGILVQGQPVSEEVREKIFDNNIFPLLQKLQEYGIRYKMPLIAAVEWGDSEQCSQLIEYVEGREPGMRLQLAMLGLCSGGSIDELLSKLILLARAGGHDSELLERMGIPKTPAAADG